jgi:methylmalonyl-CoA/ethylmalonyl-CoA epimerase
MYRAILMTAMTVLLAGLCLPSGAAAAELPEFYKKVSRLTWVVSDLDRATAGWRKIGYEMIRDHGEIEMTGELRGKPVTFRVRAASGMLGNTGVGWVQPLSGESAFSEFLASHGDGVYSLTHLVSTRQALEAEVARMKDLGVGVVMSGTLGSSGVEYVYLDTYKGGKYTLGLLYSPEGLQDPDTGTGPNITQFAFAIKDMDAVSEYWERLGWPKIEVTKPTLTDLRYRGQPSDSVAHLGWHRHAAVPYEWILSIKGPNVYEDHLRKHGEGVHHIAFNTDDMDREVARWEAAGYVTSQSGGWGEKGKAGSGRFSYQDTQQIGGTDVELLWNYRAR